MQNTLDLQKIADELEFELSDVEMLVTVFIETAEESLDAMQTAIVNNDYACIYKTAHSIKGSAANLLLVDISSLAKTLECEASNSKQINYEELFLKLSDEIKRLSNCR